MWAKWVELVSACPARCSRRDLTSSQLRAVTRARRPITEKLCRCDGIDDGSDLNRAEISLYASSDRKVHIAPLETQNTGDDGCRPLRCLATTATGVPCRVCHFGYRSSLFRIASIAYTLLKMKGAVPNAPGRTSAVLCYDDDEDI